jgi:hypothetical protein
MMMAHKMTTSKQAAIGKKQQSGGGKPPRKPMIQGKNRERNRFMHMQLSILHLLLTAHG